MFLYPKTVYPKNAKSPDIAAELVDIYSAPEYIYLTACIDGYAVLARTARVNSSSANWERVRVLGRGNLTGVEFMHRWAQNYEGVYKPYTYGEPICFWTDAYYGNTGKLYWQKNQYEQPELLVDGEVKMFAVRHGWKSVVTPETDQGLVVVYLMNAQVWMISYSEVTMGSWQWSKPVMIYSGAVKDISLSRSLDYRMLITLVTPDNRVLLVASDRTYPGTGATQPDTASTTILDTPAQRIKLAQQVVSIESEHSQITSRSYNISRYLMAQPNRILTANNSLGKTLFVTLLSDVTSYDLRYWYLEDSVGRRFSAISLERQAITPYGITFVATLEDFNNAVGDVTVVIGTGGADIEGNPNKGEMRFTFTPEGLEPTEMPKPELVSISNVWVGDDQ
jgi:hypothetical protein